MVGLDDDDPEAERGEKQDERRQPPPDREGSDEPWAGQLREMALSPATRGLERCAQSESPRATKWKTDVNRWSAKPVRWYSRQARGFSHSVTT